LLWTWNGNSSLNVGGSIIYDNIRLRFTIQDTGIGIRREDMGKLFTDYTQLDAGANRKVEGTGLGLMIVKKLVEMMGGSVSVDTAGAAENKNCNNDLSAGNNLY